MSAMRRTNENSTATGIGTGTATAEKGRDGEVVEPATEWVGGNGVHHDDARTSPASSLATLDFDLDVNANVNVDECGLFQDEHDPNSTVRKRRGRGRGPYAYTRRRRISEDSFNDYSGTAEHGYGYEDDDDDDDNDNDNDDDDDYHHPTVMTTTTTTTTTHLTRKRPPRSRSRTRTRTHPFWRAYDDVIILCIASQLGILVRILSSTIISSWENDGVFSKDSALFTNLPLNCLSCFLMGLLCSGEEAWVTVSSRGSLIPGIDDMREVQLVAMEGPMRRSPSVFLFPSLQRIENDLVQHYSHSQSQSHSQSSLTLMTPPRHSRPADIRHTHTPPPPATLAPSGGLTTTDKADEHEHDHDHENEQKTSTHDMDHDMDTFSTIAEGWDVNTSARAMSSDLLLGLRVGFCGALSTFSSWNASMVHLLSTGQTGDAIMGYIVGLALPIVSYKTGISVAVWFFGVRFRRQTRKDERRGGYALRLPQHTPTAFGEEEEEDDDEDHDQDQHTIDMRKREQVADNHDDDIEMVGNGLGNKQEKNKIRKEQTDNNTKTKNNSNKNNNNNNNNNNNRQKNRFWGKKASVRAIATVIFVFAVVGQCTSLAFYKKPNQQQFAISLLFSPLGVLCRWKLSKLNAFWPSFPVGTFCANILGCSLSGGLGEILNNVGGVEERIVLTSMISGFAGSLSTLATFVVQCTSLVEVVLFKLDGVVYAFVTLFWGIVIGLLVGHAVDWADQL